MGNWNNLSPPDVSDRSAFKSTAQHPYLTMLHHCVNNVGNQQGKNGNPLINSICKDKATFSGCYDLNYNRCVKCNNSSSTNDHKANVEIAKNCEQKI